ncbi:hypothetical protein Cni_G00289 [Canna indica]|uniref:Uncharacterized protein n=1 Tax=Canna indica TaxID=4628 RepID=A0AAQ3PWY8_9LILI|nr:hypothetical protein Cni_G00289 [Canna indica]
MTRLCSCWFIIDHVLLKEGFDRWRRLGFFVHPVFLLVFQLFRLLQLLIGRTSDSLLLIIQVAHSAVVSVYYCCRTFVFHFSEVDEISPLTSEGNTSEIFAELDVFECIVSTDDGCKGALQVFSLTLYPQGSEDEESMHHEEYQHISQSGLLEEYYEPADEDDQEPTSPISIVEDLDSPLEITGYNSSENQQYGINSSLPSTSAPSISLEFQQGRERSVETDRFIEDYNTRMRWFDRLNEERRHVVSAVLNVTLGTSSFSDRIEPLTFSFPLSAHEKLAKSIRSDFEVVYVGQTCLSWEALCYQYRKVKAIALEKDAQLIQGKVAEKFQQFQVLVDRFTENEKCQGKRFWNYASTRFCNTNLLQVPDVPGFVAEEAREEWKGESTKASVALEAIEKAMSSFWLFLRCDINKSTWGMFKKLKMIDCQVEDPRDLELFTTLSKEAQKKSVKVKELLRKGRGKRTSPGEEIQVENLICQVDVNLVMRVLKLSVITSAQLRWCHDKLNSVVFEQGTFRTTDACLLFPHS